MHGEWPLAATVHASGSAWGAIREAFLRIVMHAAADSAGPDSAIDGGTRRQPYSQKGLDFLSFILKTTPGSCITGRWRDWWPYAPVRT